MNIKHRIRLNSIWSIVYTVVLLLSGFVLPRLILAYYGSEINGLINSISQFLLVFTFMELGIAAVAKTSLYDAVGRNDQLQINRIVSAESRFYRSIGFVLVVYVAMLVVFYPRIINNEYNTLYTVILILTHSISMFAQYYFGVVDCCILDAFQEIYIYYIVQTVAVIINIAVSAIMIIEGFSIYWVKLITAVIYVVRPLVVRFYIDRRYSINRREEYDKDPIHEKWNGVAQHISFIILQSTDTVLLTLFSTLNIVSVYSVYNMVLSGMNSLVIAAVMSMTAVMGKLNAQNEKSELCHFFEKLKLGTHCMVAVCYGLTCALIVPFVLVYTAGITDAEYEDRLFAFVIVLANAWSSLRIPYVQIIQAIGGYKPTQKIFVLSAVINIGVSLALVDRHGLVGIAIGTLIAMTFQTIGLAVYVNRNLGYQSIWNEWKLFALDMIEITAIFAVGFYIPMMEYDYRSWIVKAVETAAFSIIVIIAVQSIFNFKSFRELMVTITKKFAIR